jgi:XTP/dITP diphosphohydrolase
LKRLVLATRNRGKLEELKAILSDIPMVIGSLEDYPEAPEVEETGLSYWENARLKAEGAARATGEWALGDDSGLEVDALGGEPGIHSKRFAGLSGDSAANIAKLLHQLRNAPDARRKARFRCVLALARPEEEGPARVQFFEGVVEGEIGREERGTGGFGFDPIFIVAGLERTMAELDPEVKNRISHRARAVARLKEHLAGSI